MTITFLGRVQCKKRNVPFRLNAIGIETNDQVTLAWPEIYKPVLGADNKTNPSTRAFIPQMCFFFGLYAAPFCEIFAKPNS